MGKRRFLPSFVHFIQRSEPIAAVLIVKRIHRFPNEAVIAGKPIRLGAVLPPNVGIRHVRHRSSVRFLFFFSSSFSFLCRAASNSFHCANFGFIRSPRPCLTSACFYKLILPHSAKTRMTTLKRTDRPKRQVVRPKTGQVRASTTVRQRLKCRCTMGSRPHTGSVRPILSHVS